MQKRRKPKAKKKPLQKRRPVGQPSFQSLFKRGTEMLQRGRIQQSVSHLEQAHALDPTHFDTALHLSGAYILSKKFKQAAALLELFIEEHEHHAMLWTNLGAAYLGNPILAKDADQLKAIAAFERAIEANPIAPNVAYNIGLIYNDRKDAQQAVHWFEKAIQANPNDKDARNYLEKLREEVEHS